MSSNFLSAPVLVTGATGRQGGTGRSVAEHLIRNGRHVRALVRSLDERADLLKRMGAEIVLGDFANHQSLVRALWGVKSAYFCYPVGPGIAEAAGLFAAAGREQRLLSVVDLSLAASRPDSSSPQGRAQWVAEQIFEWAGFAGTHLRVAAFFMDNLIFIDGPSIREHNRIANAFGDVSLPWIAGTDIGALAASLILEPDVARGRRTVVAGGVEMLNYPQIASAMTSVLQRNVKYEELTAMEWHRELIAASMKRTGEPNVRGADHLVAQSGALRTNPAKLMPNHILEFTGKAPMSFRQFLEAHRERLTTARA